MPPKKEQKIKQPKPPQIPLAQEYIEYYEKYSQIYGEENTVIFMQVGGFYEAYALQEKGPDLLTLSKLIGVIRTRKDKSINEITLTNPYILGFPVSAITKYTEILLENDYIIVIIDQTGNKKDPTGKIKGEERKITNIYSRGTYIENIDKKDGNYIVCVYLSNEDSLLCTGLSAIDVSTGHVFIHEAFSTKFDESFALDEIDRFITTFSPKEITIYYDQNQKKITKKCKLDNDSEEIMVKQKYYSKDYILTYLKLNDIGTRFNENVDKKYTNCIFQNEMFKLIYTDTQSLISPIEQLDLEKNTFVNTALCLSFDFIYNKNALLVSNLIKPIWFTSAKKLTLGNNAIRQLDIIEDLNIGKNKCKYRSLFHVVNQTSTAMGERFLRHRLLSPFTDPKELIQRYDQIENMMVNDYYLELEEYLDNIRDIERLQRKMALCIIKPMEIPSLVLSYEHIFDLIINIKEKKNNILSDLLPSSNAINGISDFLKHIETIFSIVELEKYSNYDFKTNIFNHGVHQDIDDLTDDVNTAHNEIENFREHLDNLIKTTATKCVHIKKNDKDGYYLSLSNLNAAKLKAKLEKLKVLKIGKITIESSSLEFKEAKKVTKIIIPSLNQESDNVEDYDKQYSDLNKKHFLGEITNISNMFLNVFKETNVFVSKVDYLKSSAKVAKLYGYVKPTIFSKQNSTKKSKVLENSFIKAKNLRHPIIERLIDHEYVPHDVELGKELQGMMLYGLNSSGKSSMMKAIGLSIVMAQAGMYVPAEEFEFYPYTSLYTRITGDDNIFRGLSSFTLEMVEVNAILKRSGKNTLVIGDEVCKGTEHVSGNALVASTILKLAQTGSTFIFATHLHEIMQIQKIKELPNVKAFHLGVTYDDKTDSLIYDRTLKEGTGNQLYGITVAQFIIQDKEFIDTAIAIKNDLLETYDSMLGSGKTSKYNSNVIVYKCNNCGKRDKKMCVTFLESHHIEFQKDCVNGFGKNKKHIKKNQESNITILCLQCHDKVHTGEIIIDGYKMTSKGKTLIINQSSDAISSHV
jgi:DNA mismatch repair protein MutS